MVQVYLIFLFDSNPTNILYRIMLNSLYSHRK